MSLFHTPIIALPYISPFLSTIVHLTGKHLYYFTLTLHQQRQRKDNVETTDLLSTSPLNYLPYQTNPNSPPTGKTFLPLFCRVPTQNIPSRSDRQLITRCARSEGVFLFIRRTPGTTPVCTQAPLQDSHLYLTNLTRPYPRLPYPTVSRSCTVTYSNLMRPQ